MDSGYEFVLVDVYPGTTNGINGAHEQVAEMKTRSKVAGGDAVADDDSAKPKVRLTRTTTHAQTDKDGSDSDKKDKKKNLRSGGGDADEAPTGAKPAAKETTSAAKPATGAVGASSKTPAPTPGAAKKKALDRDDDSGINSRASSVSNDDVATPARMRTRSSRAPDVASTSTPANRRGGAARVPLSIYEFDAASFDDDLPLAATFGSKGAGATSTAHKRKAVVYVEEMEDDEESPEGATDSAEPPPKRSAAILVSAGAGIVTSLLYPLRKLRSGIAAIRPFKAPSSATVATTDEPDQQKSGADAADLPTDTSAAASSETAAHSSEQPSSDEAADTCSLM